MKLLKDTTKKINKEFKGYYSRTIANEFIKLAQPDGGLTHTKLQKLLYFTHAMSLATYDTPLIDSEFQAWPFGPVDVKIYLTFNSYGNKRIINLIPNRKTYSGSIEDYNPDNIDKRSKELIKTIYERVGKKKDWELSEFSQPFSPWKDVFVRGESNPITNDAILEYYRCRDNMENK